MNDIKNEKIRLEINYSCLSYCLSDSFKFFKLASVQVQITSALCFLRYLFASVSDASSLRHSPNESTHKLSFLSKIRT